MTQRGLIMGTIRAWCRQHSGGVGPHGGYVNAAGFEHVTCPTCGNVAVWPPGVEDVTCVPPGHRLVRDIHGRVVDDVCPEEAP